MFIGSSYKCSEYCEEEDKRKFDKYHSEHRHLIYQSKDFQEDNREFMRKSKRTWNGFAIQLEVFFKKLKREIEFIQKQALSRLQFEEVKTAVDTSDKQLVKIASDIMQERYRNLSCQDVYDFVKLRKDKLHSSPPRINREESEFTQSVVQQIKESFRDVCQDFRQANNKHPQEQPQPRTFRKQPERPKQHRQNRIDNRGKGEQREQSQQEMRSKKLRNVEPRRREGEEKRIIYRDRTGSGEVPTKNNLRQDKYQQTQDEGPLLRISALSMASRAFSIDLKVLSYVKRLREKQVWRVSDQTGELSMVVPPHSSVKEGARIHLTHCFVRQFSEHLEIHTNSLGGLSRQAIKDESLRQGQANQRRLKQEDKEVLKEKGLTKVGEIGPESEGIKLIAKVLKVVPGDKRLYNYVIGDQTGVANACFQSCESMMKEGKAVYIRGAQVEVDEKGHLYLTGRQVLMEPAHDSIPSINYDNNISKREYVAI